MNVKRFYYVVAKGSQIVHRKYGNRSEGPTACGRHAAPGWLVSTLTRRAWLTQYRLCKHCERAE